MYGDVKGNSDVYGTSSARALKIQTTERKKRYMRYV